MKTKPDLAAKIKRLQEDASQMEMAEIAYQIYLTCKVDGVSDTQALQAAISWIDYKTGKGKPDVPS